jgi:diguanylate cyclase (GGDEF)-like protein
MRLLTNLWRSAVDALERHGLVVPAAVGALLVWIYVIVLETVGFHGGTLWVLQSAGLVLTAILLLALYREQSRLRGLVDTDALTGLINHRGFHELLRRKLEAAARDGTVLTLVHFDLDNFKIVNDTHGHPYGDDVLRGVGAELISAVRAGDAAARIGGDEFALILPGAGAEEAHAVAERARAAIGRVRVHGIELSCSAGMASYPDDGPDATALCQLADAALYWAKRDGKRRTRSFDPDRVPISWTQRDANEIDELLARPDAIVPAYQPVVALSTGRVVGYEALARFPGARPRAVNAWFAAANACGLGPRLEAAAISRALGPVDRPLETHLALNVSPSTLSSTAIADVLPDDLDGIVIEITEHELAPDDEVFLESIADLRARGALIAIDDTGAGYAGLTRVMQVRPDVVKLDRKLIDGIHTDPARQALVGSFVRFVRGIGAIACAEGIESLDDLVVLADLDVEWGQGYALSPADEPWVEISPAAVDVCRGALARALRSPSVIRSGAVDAGNRGLEHTTARLAGARSAGDLEDVLESIAEELHATNVALSRWRPSDGVIETLAENGLGDSSQHFHVRDYPLTAHVLRAQEAVQVLVGDPNCDPAEAELLLSLGRRSMLIVPVVCRGETLGIVEAFSDVERAWTRTEITRARIISNQFASVIEAFFKPVPL